MGEHSTRTKVLPILGIICATLVLISVVGGWIYVQKQQLAQKNQQFQKQLQQQKQLEEYKQSEMDFRQTRENATKNASCGFSGC